MATSDEAPGRFDGRNDAAGLYLALMLQETDPFIRVDHVCSLLANPKAFHGKIVGVRGKADRGLWGRGCQSHVVVRKHQFPDVLAVTPTTYDRRLRLHRIDFEEEGSRASEEYGSIAQHAMRYNKDLECTLVGGSCELRLRIASGANR